MAIVMLAPQLPLVAWLFLWLTSAYGLVLIAPTIRRSRLAQHITIAILAAVFIFYAFPCDVWWWPWSC